MADTTLIDPLARTIVLHDATWYGHVIKGHPDMRPLRLPPEGAITNCDEIRESASNPDCRVYYSSPGSSGIRIAVVADVILGVVKTAYRTKKMKGAIEWSR